MKISQVKNETSGRADGTSLLEVSRQSARGFSAVISPSLLDLAAEVSDHEVVRATATSTYDACARGGCGISVISGGGLEARKFSTCANHPPSPVLLASFLARAYVLRCLQCA